MAQLLNIDADFSLNTWFLALCNLSLLLLRNGKKIDMYGDVKGQNYKD